eukprot:6207741-Pleurochrysis_carterae.AAC.7
MFCRLSLAVLLSALCLESSRPSLSGILPASRSLSRISLTPILHLTAALSRSTTSLSSCAYVSSTKYTPGQTLSNDCHLPYIVFHANPLRWHKCQPQPNFPLCTGTVTM